MAECKSCEGRGLVWDVVGIIPTPYGPEEVCEEVDCEECGGTGEITQEKQEEI